jgi:hypothetical protein
MRENCTSGSVRGVPGNRHSYRGLEKIVNAACETAALVEWDLYVDYLKSQGFDKQIRNQFTFHGAVGKVESFAEVRTEYFLMTCLKNTAYVST